MPGHNLLGRSSPIPHLAGGLNANDRRLIRRRSDRARRGYSWLRSARHRLRSRLAQSRWEHAHHADPQSFSFSQNIPEGTYIVTKKLAERNGEFEYRVNSINARFERVVSQGELSEVL
jgi:hypothetical protein